MTGHPMGNDSKLEKSDSGRNTKYYPSAEPPKTWLDPELHWKVAMDSSWYEAMFVVQDEAIAAAHRCLREYGLRHMVAPVTTGSISSPMGAGSDSLPVGVELNGQHVYLADSMQFALEYGCRFVDDGVYYIMQTFRGEPADTTHLQQFCHIEFEISKPLEDTMALAWNLLRSMCVALIDRAEEQVLSMGGGLGHLESIAILDEAPRVSFDDALKYLDSEQVGYVTLPTGARVLTKAGEKAIGSRFGAGDAVWITEMDKLAVPFYQADSADGIHSKTADLLLGGLETIGSGQRHATSEEVIRGLAERDISADEYKWYLEMKEAKPLRTSGMGLGFERFLLWALKDDDIRDMPLLSRLGIPGSTP